jgi:deoxyribonuclease V
VLAAVDVAYAGDRARGACVVFASWEDVAPAATHAITTPLAAEYAPGELFRRELPPLLAVLAQVAAPLEVVIVDGYVWLAGHGAGLGAHLYDALGARVAVVGVAKTAWTRPDPAPDPARRVVPVVRGGSARPLYVTAAGMDPDVAAARVARMHGAHRLPTLLKLADTLARARN